jgi:L-seryl-tRNA(Ser) seleniumtransferase
MDKGLLLRKIPSVNEIINMKEVQQWLSMMPRPLVVKAVRGTLEELRREIRSGKKRDVRLEEILSNVEKNLKLLSERSFKPVINATGVVIHTNLGRAPLPAGAIQNILEISKGYSNLEYDLIEGRRGERYDHIRELLRELTGTEDAIAVNNNAAAVLLCLSALAQGREVIVSRGELVEIGGAFRIPDVMKQSGAILKEVGTTNKTRLKDYENAINEETALLLKVHQSNYRIIGFTEEVPVEELVELGRKREIPVMFDLGSGCFIDLSEYGLQGEPVVSEIVKKGVDIVTFSGDKLLGGPQAGIILGRRELIRKIAHHPLTRAVRIDKLTLAALETVLYLYLDPDRAKEEIPILRMLLQDRERIKKRAQRIIRAFKGHDKRVMLKLQQDYSQAGGGSLPGISMPTYVIAFGIEGVSAVDIEAALRMSSPAVVARIKEDTLIIDPRTVDNSEVPLLIKAIEEVIDRFV